MSVATDLPVDRVAPGCLATPPALHHAPIPGVDLDAVALDDVVTVTVAVTVSRAHWAAQYDIAPADVPGDVERYVAVDRIGQGYRVLVDRSVIDIAILSPDAEPTAVAS